MHGVQRGKREENRRRTRSGLRRHALERFREQGFEKTRVADIARDAGVSERTFYAHFASKEAVLFQDYESRLDWFRAALEMRPDDESILDSVRVAVRSFPGDPEMLRQIARLRASVLPPKTIEAHLRQVGGAYSREIEAQVRARWQRPGDPELGAAVMGNAIGGALLAVLDVWSRRGGSDPAQLDALTGEALALLRGGFA